MKILVPSKIVASSFKPGTSIPEVDTDAGEVAWSPTGAYAVHDLRVYDGNVYSCVLAHTSKAGDPKPDEAVIPARWLFKEPSNRMRPFDEYLYTKARRQQQLKYVLNVPFATGFAMHGVDADRYDFVYRDTPNDAYPEGEILGSSSGQMWAQAYGHFELLFGNLQRTTKWTSPRLPLRPSATAEITLTRNDPNAFASVGWIGIGQWHEIKAPGRDVGATEQGMEYEPRTTARRKDNGDGTYTRTRGLKSKVGTGTAIFDAKEAPRVAALLDQALDQIVAVDFSDMPRFAHLSGVGHFTGTIAHTGYEYCRMRFTMDGNV